MKTKRILSIALTLVMLLGMLPGMNLTAYAANNLTIYIMDMLENMDDNEWGYQLYDGDVSIAEGTYVQINMGTWHTGVMNIYMNGEVVYTKPSGSLYKDDVYHFTAGPNCKILGGYQNMFDWDGNPNVYITQDASVAVTGVTLNPNTAQTIDVGGSVAFTATVEPAGASDKTVKWSVGGTNTGAVKLYSDEACTTEVGANATDKLTVYAKGISAGSATITATSNADSEKKASCDVTVNAAQTQTEELLTTITAVGASNASTATSANVSYSTEDIATLTFSQVTPDGYGRVSYVPTWGWWGYGITLTVTPADGYTITKCVFYDDANRTATDSEAPFVVETAEEGDKAPKVNGTPILAYTSKGIKKIEVYGYATPTATHSVTITPGDNMTKTAGSGDAEQTGLTGAMTDVVYTADNGYYYPTDYSVAEVSGIKVTRDSYTQITVSGTPTADATITLTAPTAKTTPAAPTTAGAVDCTTSDNNDGKLTGVTTAMEYKKSDAESWTVGTGSDITGLVPGTYYVRLKATDTTNASANQELTIKGFISYTVTFKVVNGKWNEGEGDAATADKTVTLTGHDGDTLKLTADQIPAVGSKPNDTYKAGSWDTTPSADTAITAATTYTYTYAAKEASVVSKAPEPKTLTYTGSAQELVTAGVATGGELRYALGDANGATQPYTTSIPTGTEAGTYYVWYKVVGDSTHTDTEPVSITVTIANRPSTPYVPYVPSNPAPAPVSEAYTVPVSNENTVDISVNISEGNAVVQEITQADLDKITDDTSGSGSDGEKKTDDDTISIDVSGAKSEVTSVELSGTSVETLAKTVEENERVDSVEIKLTNATVELDSAAVSAISEQKEGNTVKLVVENKEQTKLNETQKESLNSFSFVQPFQAYFESGGKEIHDFKGGKATVSIKFTPEAGRDVKHYHMYYVPLNGIIERYATRYLDGILIFVTSHFSDYAIVYDETMENETGKEDVTPSPSPSMAPGEDPGVSPSQAPSASAEPGVSPSASAEPSQAPSASAEPSVSPSASAEPSVSPSASAEPSVSPSVSAEPGVSPSASAKPGVSPSASAEPGTVPSTEPSQAPSGEKTGPVTAQEQAQAALDINAGLKVIHNGTSASVQWSKVDGAKYYKVYAAYCGSKYKMIKTVDAAAKCKVTIKKLNGKKLSTTKNIKVYVAAYRTVETKNGETVTKKDVRIAKTIAGHVVGKKNKKYSNAKKIKLSKTSYTLKKGKKAKIKAKTVLQYPKRKQLGDAHAKEFRYASSDKSIATVSKSGKITAKKKGSCVIYVYARNGLAKKVKVTVK